MTYDEKRAAYDELVKEALPNSRQKDPIDEISGWAYWQGGRDNLNAKILLIGRDVGNDQLAANVAQARKEDPNRHYLPYEREKTAAADLEICRLFEILGYDVTPNHDYPNVHGDIHDLFFTALLGDRSTDQYIVRLMDIIQPQVTLCLSKATFERVLMALGVQVPSGKFSELIDMGGIDVQRDGYLTRVFSLADTGSLGINNRGRLQKGENADDGLTATERGRERMNTDWRRIADYLWVRNEHQ